MKTVLASAAALTFLVAAVAQAQEPVQNISLYRHGNLAAAQQLTTQALDRLTFAQRTNNHDFGGHVGRAKSLLRQATWEIKKAAVFTNRR
jgi:hypothetical protein